MTEEYFIYQRNKQHFGVPVNKVLEIVEINEIKNLNVDLFGCLGCTVNRDQLIPVFDSMMLGTMRHEKVADLNTVIIIRSGETTFGLTIDRYLCVEHVSTRSKGDEGTEEVRNNKYISAIVGYQQSSLILFSIERISHLVYLGIDEQKIISEQEGQLILDKGPSEQSLCISIENMMLAIQMEHILEVIEGYEVAPFFGVHESLRGLINLRGNVIACIDISKEIGFELKAINFKTKFVIIKYGSSTIALCVDEVHGIKNLYSQDIQKVETVLSEKQQVFIEGIYKEEKNTLLLLTIPEIFKTEHLVEFTDLESSNR